MAKYSAYMTLGQIMNVPELKAVVLKHLPGAEADPRYSMGKMYTLNEIKYEVDGALRATIEKIAADLGAVEY